MEPPIIGFYHTVLNRRFFVQRRTLKYYTGRSIALSCERTVELPFAMRFIEEHAHDRFLEVGNVISHYFNFDHTVIDKYEISPEVINEDVMDHTPPTDYQLIISISTVEHIGLDEEIKDDTKCIRTIERLKTWLEPSGIMLITVPIGTNPVIDRMILDNTVRFTDRVFLKRKSVLNNWVETNVTNALHATYNLNFPFANAVAFLIFERNEST